MFRVALVLLLVSFAHAWFLGKTKTVCYKRVGCFSNGRPFNNAGGLLPKSPTKIDTHFWLYSRQHPTVPQAMYTADKRLADNLNINANAPTTMIIHGYRNTRNEWIKDMAKELLLKKNQNVVAVDWTKGAKLLNYLQAVANTRVVGAEASLLLSDLVLRYKISLASVYLIGHSLGAHVAGYTGQRNIGLGRITGLDPANLAFKNRPGAVRLDRTDAVFVDIIHSDAAQPLHMGLRAPIGQADFYPNGAHVQPGCVSAYKAISYWWKHKDESFSDILACSHKRSIQLFIESINGGCAFLSFPCPVIDGKMTSTSCNACAVNGCPRMGYYAQADGASGTFYVKTNSRPPFCISHKSRDIVYKANIL